MNQFKFARAPCQYLLSQFYADLKISKHSVFIEVDVLGGATLGETIDILLMESVSIIFHCNAFLKVYLECFLYRILGSYLWGIMLLYNKLLNNLNQ